LSPQETDQRRLPLGSRRLTFRRRVTTTSAFRVARPVASGRRRRRRRRHSSSVECRLPPRDGGATAGPPREALAHRLPRAAADDRGGSDRGKEAGRRLRFASLPAPWTLADFDFDFDAKPSGCEPPREHESRSERQLVELEQEAAELGEALPALHVDVSAVPARRVGSHAHARGCGLGTGTSE